MPRTNYIFIDYENVCESDLSRVRGKSARVYMIVGAAQKSLSTSLFLFSQGHPNQLRVIQTPVAGKNALDFVLTLELGRTIEADPEGYFHIISKDTDFDSVLRHLKGEKKHIARHASLADIPALRTPEERVARIKAELASATNNRPSTRKTLVNKISSAFEHKAEPEFIENTIKSFVHAGLLDFTETDKVLYKIA
jgi:PIN domain